MFIDFLGKMECKNTVFILQFKYCLGDKNHTRQTDK